MKKTILGGLGIFLLVLIAVYFMTGHDNTYYKVYTDREFYYIKQNDNKEIDGVLEKYEFTTVMLYNNEKYEVLNNGESLTIYIDRHGGLWIKANYIRNEMK